jgi:hypothetical protein
MGSSETIGLEAPRSCWRLKRLRAANRTDDLLLIRIQPAIPSGQFGFDIDIDVVVIATRLGGDSLFPINTFPDRPVPVYVARLLVDGVETRTKLEPGEFDMFAWAELYPSAAEASARFTYAQAEKFGRKI